MRSVPLSALAIAAAMLLQAPGARAQSSHDAETRTADPAARALDVILEHDGGRIRVVVPLDRTVQVTEEPGSARVVYRLAGARVAGRRRPVTSPDDADPVVRVELVPQGRDVQLVVEVRRPVGVRHRVVETPQGWELRVELSEVSSTVRPAGAVVAPPAPKPPGQKPPALPSRAPETPASGEERTLGGHTFLTPAGFPSAFPTTHLGLSLGFASASFASVDARDRKHYSAAIGSVFQRLELGVRIHPRLGLVASGGGAFAAGLDEATLLNLGADGAGTWMLGATGVVARLDRTGTIVGARLSVDGGGGGRVASLARLFKDAIAMQKMPAFSTLGSSLSSQTGRFAWSAAQAVGAHLSAQASLGWAATWIAGDARSTEHTLDLTTGLALTADLAPWFPAAILVEYDGDAILNRSGARPAALSEVLSDRGTSSFLAGIHYSGRRDLLLGVLGGIVGRAEGLARTNAQGRLEIGYFF